MNASENSYPLFRSTFLASSLWIPARLDDVLHSSCLNETISHGKRGSLPGNATANTSMFANPDRENSPSAFAQNRASAGASTSGQDGGSKNARLLDLRGLNNEPGQITERDARRQKMAYFDKRCSKVIEGLYMGSEHVARNRELLEREGITHVLNCVGALYQEFFPDKFAYKTLYLADTPQEDISCVFHDCFDFIEGCRKAGGRVLVHCSQGVSRSATIVIAYCMWKLDQNYDLIFDHLKKIRGVVNPNIGFTCALLAYQKRRSSGVKRCLLTRLCPQSDAAPHYIVPRTVPHACPAALDSRGVFIVHTPGKPGSKLYIWIGSRAMQPFVQAAERIAVRMCKYDNLGQVSVEVAHEGREPAAMMAALMSPDTGADSFSGVRTPPVASAAVPFPHFNREYDADYARVDAAGAGGSSTARSSGNGASSGLGGSTSRQLYYGRGLDDARLRGAEDGSRQGGSSAPLQHRGSACDDVSGGASAVVPRLFLGGVGAGLGGRS